MNKFTNNNVACEIWDDDWDFDLLLVIKYSNSVDEFLETVNQFIQPMVIGTKPSYLGGVKCEFQEIQTDVFPFPQNPVRDANFVIRVSTTKQTPWCYIDRIFAISLARSLKQLSECEICIVTDDFFPVCCFGNKKNILVNDLFEPWNKELSCLLHEMGLAVERYTLDYQ